MDGGGVKIYSRDSLVENKKMCENWSFKTRHMSLLPICVQLVQKLLADPGEARGCSINSLVIN